MAQKLPDYPEAGGLQVADAQAHLSNVSSSPNWGTNVSAYTAKATGSLQLSDPVRQRFIAQANRRVSAAVARIARLEDFVSGNIGELEKTGYRMSQGLAQKELERVMHRSVEGQLGEQTRHALLVLPDGDPTKKLFMTVLAGRLEAERRIRDEGSSAIANLPLGAS